MGFDRVGSVVENRIISKWGQTGVRLTETSQDIFTAGKQVRGLLSETIAREW